MRLGSWIKFGIVLLILVVGIPPVHSQEADYSISVRPGPKNKPTEVKLGIVLVDINEIDGASQTITANIFIQLEWRDPRLSRAIATKRKMRLAEVWNPRVQILNQRKLFKTLPEVVEVEPNGTVFYRQRYWGQFSFPFNLRDFPLDQNQFAFNFVAVGFSPDEVQLVGNMERTGVVDKLTLIDWEITSWATRKTEYQLRKGLPKSPGYVFEFNGRRLLGFYVFKVFLPLCMVIFMSWIIFWIDPEDFSSKISVAVTAMLTLIAYRFLLQSFLPKVSYLTRLDYFLLASTILVFGALVESGYVYKLKKENREGIARKVDNRSKVLFPTLFILSLVLSFVV